MPNSIRNSRNNYSRRELIPLNRSATSSNTDLTNHARDRMKQYRIDPTDMRRGIGRRWTIDRGVVKCRTALDGPVGVGDPIIIGHGYTAEGARAETLLVQTPQGRLLHCVVTVRGSHRLCVITAWDPTTAETRHLWRPDFLVPTVAGAHSSRCDRWIAGDPYGHGQFAPRLRHINRYAKRKVNR